MGEEFHAVLKLITGEEIFALVSVDENDGDSIITVSYTHLTLPTTVRV